jgi:hypothetical protein
VAWARCGWLLSKTLWASRLMDSESPRPGVRIGIVEREARLAEKLSAKHARLVEIYGTPDPGLSLEQGLRRQRLAHYHAMLSKAALRRELLKVNPNRQSPAPGADGSQLAFAGF